MAYRGRSSETLVSPHHNESTKCYKIYEETAVFHNMHTNAGTPAHTLVSLRGQRHVLNAYVPHMFPNCGARNPWDAVRSLVGASCLYEGHTYFELNIGGRYICFGGHFARLKYFTYRLVPVKKAVPQHATEALGERRYSSYSF
jgi:hypothetical protein